MKKMLYLSLIFLVLSGCNKKLKEEDKSIKKNKPDVSINEVEEEPYVDNNPLKIAFYKKDGNMYKRLDKYEKKVTKMEVIDTFSIVLSKDDEIKGNSIKNLYNTLKELNPEINNYKIGYNLKFTIKDGTIINQNVLKPLDYGSYGFSPYIYAWLYDDINTVGWHSHIEEKDYNDNTIMSSIKLMWGPRADEINSDIELTVFTYCQDDFDEFGNYRGISKFTTIIERR